MSKKKKKKKKQRLDIDQHLDVEQEKKQQLTLEQHNHIAAEAVRMAVVTLSHHINNQLMVIDTSLSLMAEKLLNSPKLTSAEELKKMIAQSKTGTERITAVLKALQQINHVEPITYSESTKMLDISAAIEQQLNEMTSGSSQP